jgi:hypothetical protein
MITASQHIGLLTEVLMKQIDSSSQVANNSINHLSNDALLQVSFTSFHIVWLHIHQSSQVYAGAAQKSAEVSVSH